MARRSFVERRNYSQLQWTNTYDDYYSHDWKKETIQYLSDNIKTTKRDFTTNWKFNIYNNSQLPNIPEIAGHSLSDIGDSMIFIGDRKRKTRVDVYKMNKYLNKFEKLITNGRSPCCRFHHSANYIPSINCILFFGGFDSQSNFNDAWLLCLDDLSWYELVYNVQIDYRAHHSSTSRMLKDTFEIYIFGGQYCNGGPYEYHNDLFLFTFVNGNYIDNTGNNDEKEHKSENEMNFGYFECEEMEIFGKYKPCARSMSYSWIKDNIYYIYGGSVANYTLNDLWMLDLNINVWCEIRCEGILRGPKIVSIKPQDFRVLTKRKPCFFDEKLNQLIVIHYGRLTKLQREFLKYDDTLSEFEHRIKLINKMEKKQKDVKSLQSTCTIFKFDLREKKWYIERNMNKKEDLPSKLIGSTRVIRIGQYLIQMGGGYKNSKVNYMKNLYLLKIPNYKIKDTMSWNRERLIWISHYKEESGGDTVSIFNKCPRDIVAFIISFLNPH